MTQSSLGDALKDEERECSAFKLDMVNRSSARKWGTAAAKARAGGRVASPHLVARIVVVVVAVACPYMVKFFVWP